jgi:MFS family permease
MKLFCDLEWARDLLQSIFSIGAFVGLIIINMVSDAKGRKIAYVTSALVSSTGIIGKSFIKIGSFIGAYFNVVSLSIIGQFLIGFGSYALVTLAYTLLSDFCSDGLRSKAIVILNSVWYKTCYVGDFQLLCLEFFIWLD